MGSKNDSDATYCSEVEELIKISSRLPKSCENVTLRRSQRLSQKLKQAPKISWDNVRISNCGLIIEKKNKVKTEQCLLTGNYSQNVFSTQDLREDQENNFSALNCQQYNFPVNDVGGREKSFKLPKVQEDVPLDLLNKSKVSIRETSLGELKAANEFKFLGLQNGMEILKNNTKGEKYTKKPARFKKSKVGKYKIPNISNINENPPAVKQILNENIKKSASNKGKSKQTYETIDHINGNRELLIKNLQTITTRANKLTNLENLNITNSNLIASKNENFRKTIQNLDISNPAETVSETHELLKINSTTSNSENFEVSTSFDSTTRTVKLKSLKRSNKLHEISNDISGENNTVFPQNRIKLSKGNITLREAQNDKKLCQKNCNIINETKTGIGLKKTRNTRKCNKKLKDENVNKKTLGISNNSKIFDNQETNRQNLTQIIKRTISCYKENNCYKVNPQITKQLNELPHIKSEPFTSLEINTKTLNETNSTSKIKESLKVNNCNNTLNEFINCIGNKRYELRNNTPKVIIKTSSSQKSNKISQTYDVKNNKFPQRNLKQIANNYKHIETDLSCHMKQNSQISKNKLEAVKPRQKRKYTKSIKKQMENSKQNLENLTNQNVLQNNKIQLKTSNEINLVKPSPNMENKGTALNTIKTSEQSSFSVNKNVMQYFDKTLYLDKIQKASKYLENLNSHNCNLQIPPTPAESTQDLLKKSVLPETYPPHFKNQLPSSVLLTPSLNPPCQQHHQHHLQSNVITPDDSITSELLESASSSPSLPESLCELLQTKDIKEILNIEKVSYRLYNYHVQALALILNIRLEYLCQILDKIMQMKTDVLRNIDKVVKTPFVPDNDLFASSSDEMKLSDEFVFNSQSPKQRKISIFT